MSEEFTEIRRAACAGSWYPGTPSELAQTLAGYFSQVEKKTLGESPLALIVPHAGYVYSGMTAAKAYKQIEGQQYDTVVVVAPSHKVFFKGCSVFNGKGYETPLGLIETDVDLSERLGSILPQVYLSKMGHAEGQTRGEHALELQLPFLQIVLGKFKLVAVVMGDQEEDSIIALGEALATALAGTNTLLVASTDLSHFYPEKQAKRLDKELIESVKQFDPESLIDKLERGKTEACGGGIVAAVMKAAKRLGGTSTELLAYTNSGEVTGDFEEVVGYLSAIITLGKKTRMSQYIGEKAPTQKKEEFSLTDDDKEKLKEIAHDAIKARLDGKSYKPPFIEHLNVKRGLFVTLKIEGELRGCIGLIKAREAIFDAVAEMACAAAFEDPRFPQLSDTDFEKLEYEISILSPLKRVHEIREIKVGRDGLLIKLDMHSGLLLPQVAVEHDWDERTFVEQTCLKAGLPKISYKDRECELYRFEADVF